MTVGAQPTAVGDDGLSLELPCDAGGSATLATPREELPYYRKRPFGEVVGQPRASSQSPDGCETSFELTEAGRAMPRPLPVQVVGSRPTWHFLLPPG